MDMEHIKPSTMSPFRVTLNSAPHLLMSFIDSHILMLNYCNIHITVKG